MSLTLSRWQKAPYVFINGELGENVRETLDQELSYEVPDAQYTDAWKNGEWDGRHRLLRQSSNGNLYFPEGCLPRVRDVLDRLNVNYDVEGLVRPGRGDLDIAWESDMTLRDYQQEAVDECLKNGAGVVVLPTGTGKTLIGLKLIEEIKRPAIVLCHQQEIADQWVERIGSTLGVDAARYYGGTRENGDIMVALYQSIYDEGDIRDDARLDHDVAIFDETHRVGADTFSRVAMSVNARYRYGLTATPEREDNATLRVIGGTGPFIADLSAERMIDEGWLAEPQFEIKRAPPAGGSYRQWQDEYREEIVENEARNAMIAEAVADLEKPCYVHVERINHGERLESMIPDAQFVYSDSSDREETIQAFKDGEIPVLISTLLGEGFDLPAMASLVMAGGLKTSVGAIQKVGRALRPETETATIVDFNDRGHWVSEHSAERIRTYRNYYGKYGP